MSRFVIAISLLFALIPSALMAASPHAVDPNVRYNRLIALVHLVGSGKPGDPRRPEFLPQPSAAPDPGRPGSFNAALAAAPTYSRAGILAWSMQLADNEQMAIVQYVAADPAAFTAIKADKRQDIRIFEIGKDSRQTIETELRKFKKDFSLENFKVAAQ